MRNIPVLYQLGPTIPEAWENAVLKLYAYGIDIPSQHDREGDPPTKDCTMTIEVRNPMQEPRVHRFFPAGLEDLADYVDEVIHGLHDERVNGWGYSYWRRLRQYEILDSTNDYDWGVKFVDQIQVMIDKLVECYYTRRAQAITWDVSQDNELADPPCFQRVWGRMLPDDDGVMWLNANFNLRSNDALKAAFMNMYALSELQAYMAGEIEGKICSPVMCGRLVWVADSFHLYGKHLTEGDFDAFYKMTKRPLEKRTWTSDKVRR